MEDQMRWRVGSIVMLSVKNELGDIRSVMWCDEGRSKGLPYEVPEKEKFIRLIHE